MESSGIVFEDMTIACACWTHTMTVVTPGPQWLRSLGVSGQILHSTIGPNATVLPVIGDT